MTNSRNPADVRARRSPTRLPGWVTKPLSCVYGWEIARRNARFDRGVGVERIDRPVISVGNLSAGGTGKTPMVRWIVSELQGMGHHPAIAMRGYKAKPGQMSDEQAEHSESMPGVPIVARPDRINGLLDLFATEEGRKIDVVVLDDGFQHRRLARDLDIVLVDATRPAHEDSLIPQGFLREGLGSLERADVVVLTRTDVCGEDRVRETERVLRNALRSNVPVMRGEHRWGGVCLYRSGEIAEEFSVEALAGRSLFVSCAIGNPQAFRKAIEMLGVDICGSMTLEDHASFDQKRTELLVAKARKSGAEGLIVTAKDWVKLRTFQLALGELPVYVPRVDIRLRDQESVLDRLQLIFSDH